MNGAPFYVMDRVDGRILRSVDDLADAHARRGGARAHASSSTCSPASTPSTTRPSGWATSAVPTGSWSASSGAGASSGSGPRPKTCPRSTTWAGAAAPPRCPSRDRPRSCTATTGSTTRCWPPTTRRRIVAVLDWEMSTLGDPLADVGLFLLYWGQSDGADHRDRRGDRTSSRASSAEDEIVEHYAKVSGRDGRQPRLLRRVRVLQARDHRRGHRTPGTAWARRSARASSTWARWSRALVDEALEHADRSSIPAPRCADAPRPAALRRSG